MENIMGSSGPGAYVACPISNFLSTNRYFFKQKREKKSFVKKGAFLDLVVSELLRFYHLRNCTYVSNKKQKHPNT